MTSLLRQLVAGPRAQHAESGLDLCYVTDKIIVISGPSSTYPERAYRNPTDTLVKFLDEKHGEDWAIWEFRAEGTGYPDSEVHGRVHHFPWPDHHPPPFQLVPNIMGSIRNWLSEPAQHRDGRVVVVHCKAGKGRSGSMACSYLISHEGWEVRDALAQFTQRRMRSGFGNGVSIPSQLRYISYVEYWTNHNKQYLERPIEILEIHVWGLRAGVKLCVQGYVEEGKKITTFHTFNSEERLIIDATEPNEKSTYERLTTLWEKNNHHRVDESMRSELLASMSKPPTPNLIDGTKIPEQPAKSSKEGSEPGGKAVIFRPTDKLVVPSSDILIDLERRNKAAYGWTLVTGVAHVWFNAYFEGRKDIAAQDSSPDLKAGSHRGVFEIDWDAMDGIKGTSRKGTQALDKIAVVWRIPEDEKADEAAVIEVPEVGQPVPEAKPADWKGEEQRGQDDDPNKDVGLRVENPASANISKASSLHSNVGNKDTGKDEKDDSSDYEQSLKGVKAHGVEDKEKGNTSSDEQAIRGVKTHVAETKEEGSTT